MKNAMHYFKGVRMRTWNPVDEHPSVLTRETVAQGRQLRIMDANNPAAVLGS